jgi:hypothetical protein
MGNSGTLPVPATGLLGTATAKHRQWLYLCNPWRAEMDETRRQGDRFLFTAAGHEICVKGAN